MSFFDRMKSVKEMFGHYTAEPPKAKPDNAWTTQAGGENTSPDFSQERTYMDPKFVNVRKDVVRKGNETVVEVLLTAATGGPREPGPTDYSHIFKGDQEQSTKGLLDGVLSPNPIKAIQAQISGVKTMLRAPLKPQSALTAGKTMLLGKKSSTTTLEQISKDYVHGKSCKCEGCVKVYKK